MLLNVHGSLSAKNYRAKGSELLNSKDPFAVAVTTGELIVDCQKFCSLLEVSAEKMGQFCVELLDLWLNDNVLSSLNSLSARDFGMKKISCCIVLHFHQHFYQQFLPLDNNH